MPIRERALPPAGGSIYFESIWNDVVRRGVVSLASARFATEPLQGKRCYPQHGSVAVMCVEVPLRETILQTPGDGSFGCVYPFLENAYANRKAFSSVPSRE